MKAGVFRGIRQIAVEEVPEPVPGAKDIVLEVEACGICGSDLHTFTHGSFVEPGQIMGHEFSGRVVAVGSDVEDIAEGDRVTALPLVACGRCSRCLEGNRHLCEVGLASSIAFGLPGAFAEYVRVPNAVLGHSAFRIPEEVSFEEAATVEPLSVAIHAVRLAHPSPSDTVVVIGLGSIGLNIAQTAKALGGGMVIGVDVSKPRLEVAAKLGIDVVINGGEEDPLERVRSLTGTGAYGIGARADVVFESSGVPTMLGQAIHMVRHGGTLAVSALYDEPVPVDGTMIVQKELRFQGTFAYKGEFRDAIELIRTGRVRVEPLVSHRFSLEEVQEAFETQLARDKSVKVLVEP